MQLTGMLHGARLLKDFGFPTAEVLGPEASDQQIKDMIARHGEVFIKPVFRGGVGKKGKSGLIGRAKDLRAALQEKERLYFCEHKVGNAIYKSHGVTFEGAVPARHEVYFSITDLTRFRAPTITISHCGGVDIEDAPRDKIAEIPFDPLTGLKSFVIANALTDLNAPKEIVSPLVQHLPKLWDLYHHNGMTLLELNPIRMSVGKNGALLPVACDFKCAFDRDDPRVARLDLPPELFVESMSEFEEEINSLRTYQGQSDVYVINPQGTILAPTFGGGANSLVTEGLGEDAIISSDFGGNPPYEKMRSVMSICLKHWLKQTNVLFVIGGKANNTDIFVTFRAMADALRDYVAEHGPQPIFVVIGRGGVNLARGMLAFKDVLDSLGLPYRIFAHDSAISDVVRYAQDVDKWMKGGGREKIAKKLGIAPGAASGKGSKSAAAQDNKARPRMAKAG